MQHSLQSMIGFTIRATDGDLGKIHEFYFDDATWRLRYMVAETGTWLSGRKVLISLVALGKPDWESRTFSVNLTCVQVRNSPDIDTELPVYRQHETALHEYYQWERYWEGVYGGAFGITPFPLFENTMKQKCSGPDQHDDPHLRSTRRVIGYSLHAADGDIGHVEDFIVDDNNWEVRNLVVVTGNWLPGRQVLIPPLWIKCMNWTDASVHLDRTQEEVKSRPDFEFSKTVHSEYDKNVLC